MSASGHFWLHFPPRSPSAGPSSAGTDVAPTRVLATFSTKTRFVLIIGFSFLPSLSISYVDFVSDASWHVFSYFFLKIMKMCSPPKQAAHFHNTIFTNIVCMTTFPCPKWLRTVALGASFLSCAVAKTICFAD